MSDKYVVAVDHIDLAFVYPEEELAEYLDILLERVLQMMKRAPQTRFALEQVCHYRELKKRRPDLFEQVREMLGQGRMEFMGAMASSAETNFPNGECLVRNQLLGLEWAAENLNTVPDSAWLVDTFGIHAQVPQILKQFGFTRLFANRFGGDKRFDLFYAQGLDGSRILVLGRDLASQNLLPDSQAFYFCRKRKDADRLFEMADQLQADVPHLVVYYIENEIAFSEYYQELTERKNRETKENWKLSSYREYTEALEKSGFEAPVLSGDLNPEFTGTFALRGRIKTENRRAETLLLEAEKWCALFHFHSCRKELEECWWKLFQNQFHDAFSGSVEDDTYFRIIKRFRWVAACAEAAIRSAVGGTDGDGDFLTCMNGLPWSREAWVPIEPGRRVLDEDGKVVTMGEEGGKTFFQVKLPPVGMISYRTDSGVAETKEEPAGAEKEIANEALRLCLDERYGIRSLELADGRKLMENASDFLVVQQDNGGMQIEDCTGTELCAVNSLTRITGKKRGSMGEQITMTGEISSVPWCNGPSWLKWEAQFSARKGEPGLRLHLTLDWKGEYARIRLRFPCLADTAQAVCEIPFGVVTRGAYEDRPTAKGEWPVHRFAACEDGEIGLAVVNRGIAGVEPTGHTLAVTLLRAYGKGPDAWVRPTEISCQHGKQEFDFLLVPYRGSWKKAGVLQLAQEFNQEVLCVKTHSRLPEVSFFETDRPNLVLSCIKEAQDGSGELVVRCYETFGEEGEGVFRCRGMRQAWMSDVTERRGKELPCENECFRVPYRPFEIQTFRIRSVL